MTTEPPAALKRQTPVSMLDWLRSPPFLWQMRLGERLRSRGRLSWLQPALSIEIGTAGGGSLSSISAHSRQVHSFEIDPGFERLRKQFPNVVFHVGDSANGLALVVLGERLDEERSPTRCLSGCTGQPSHA